MDSTKYCNNRSCQKQHCWYHRSNHNFLYEISEDKNVDNKFKCPSYLARYKKRYYKKEY